MRILVKNMSEVDIVVESREPLSIYQKLCERIGKDKYGDDIVKRGFLDVGDYLLINGYAIERKKDRDLTGSLNSKRLYAQLNALYESAETGKEVFLRFKPNKCRLGIKNGAS